jgi:hypothetical protein
VGLVSVPLYLKEQPRRDVRPGEQEIAYEVAEGDILHVRFAV